MFAVRSIDVQVIYMKIAKRKLVQNCARVAGDGVWASGLLEAPGGRVSSQGWLDLFGDAVGWFAATSGNTDVTGTKKRKAGAGDAKEDGQPT